MAEANIWECPNLVRVPSADPGGEDRWVLLVSLWRWVDEVHELAGVRYLVGDLQPDGPGLRFVAESGGVLDDGPSFYAPQVLPDGDRVLVWGWAWEVGRTENQVRDAGWAGVLTFPRELFVRDGVLGARPAAELQGLRAGPLELTPEGTTTAPAFELRSVVHRPAAPARPGARAVRAGRRRLRRGAHDRPRRRQRRRAVPRRRVAHGARLPDRDQPLGRRRRPRDGRGLDARPALSPDRPGERAR